MAPYTITIQPGALLSAEEYAQQREEEGWRTELVEGRVIRMPLAGYQHDRIVTRLIVALGAYVDTHGLGECTLEQAGYDITQPAEAATVRAPDLAFVRAERVPKAGDPRHLPYPRLAPDLVVEVVSPSQSRNDMAERSKEWLKAGVRLVWVIWPETRRVQVWRSGKRVPVALLGEEESLDGLDVVPGFTFPVARLFG